MSGRASEPDPNTCTNVLRTTTKPRDYDTITDYGVDQGHSRHDVAIIWDILLNINGRDRTTRVYHIGRGKVWALTARIIQNLLERVGPESADV